MTGLLRALVPADLGEVLEVYRDAVLSQAPSLYTPEQVHAWAHLAAGRPEFPLELERGVGLASLDQEGGTIEAFGLLEPADRISLLYCRGRSCRQGRATALLRELESRARAGGCRRMRTEASFLSRSLFEREGWQVQRVEELMLAGVEFRRFRMAKTLAD
jgi:GNAT superfamily N-acetyltransferase